jgi:hypothetical protein
MQGIKRWFGWTAVIGPIHICEQLLFGIDQLDELKGFADGYYSLFNNPNYGTVLLVMFGFSLFNLIVYGLLKGGRWALASMSVFALVAVGEMYHIIKSIVHASYDIGTATAIPFVIFGALLSRELMREFRKTSAPVVRRRTNKHKQYEPTR